MECEVSHDLRGGADRASAEAAVGFLVLLITTDPARDNSPSRSRVSSPAKLPITIDTISMGFSLKCLDYWYSAKTCVEMLPDRFRGAALPLARLDTTDARDEVRKDTRRRDAGDWGVRRGPPVDRLRVRAGGDVVASASHSLFLLLQTFHLFPTTSPRLTSPLLPSLALSQTPEETAQVHVRGRRRGRRIATRRRRGGSRRAGQGAERGGRGGVLRGQRRRGRPKARGRPAGRREAVAGAVL